MKYLLAFFLIIFGNILSGCVTAPTQQQIAEADYGDYPENYQEIIKQYMATRLKDPSSAQYTFLKTPAKMWGGGALSGPIKYGYGTCAAINAKNSFGAFTGAQKRFFLINNGTVVQDLLVTEYNAGACI